MPRNSSGIYYLPAGNPVVADTVIEADGWANPTLSDLGNEITGSLARDGRGGMTGSFSIVDGDVSSPGLRFTLDTNNGIYRSSADAWGLASGSTPVLNFSPNNIQVPANAFCGILGGLAVRPSITLQMADATPSGTITASSSNGLTIAASAQIVNTSNAHVWTRPADGAALASLYEGAFNVRGPGAIVSGHSDMAGVPVGGWYTSTGDPRLFLFHPTTDQWQVALNSGMSGAAHLVRLGWGFCGATNRALGGSIIYEETNGYMYHRTNAGHYWQNIDGSITFGSIVSAGGAFTWSYPILANGGLTVTGNLTHSGSTFEVTNYSYAHTTYFHIGGSSANYSAALQLINSSGTYYRIILSNNYGAPANITYDFAPNGVFTAPSNVAVASDRRLKTDIRPITNALAAIAKLDGYYFNRIGVEGLDAGMVAQQVHEAFPEGVCHDEKQDTWSVKIHPLLGLLVSAINELAKKVK